MMKEEKSRNVTEAPASGGEAKPAGGEGASPAQPAAA
jgi:hypothetical protein